MSPAAALDSSIFRTYAVIAAAILTLAATTLVVLRFGLRKEVAGAWDSLCGWLVMLPLVTAVVFLGRVATIVFFAIVALAGLREYARATRLNEDRLMTALVAVAIAAAGVTALVPDPLLGTPGWYGLYMALPVYVIAAILLVPIVRNRSEGQLRSITLAVLGFLYIGWCFQHLSLLADSHNPYGYLLYLLLAVELNDVAAFTFGKLLGRHPLRSNISPKKTWEGALGAVAVSLALPWLLKFSFPFFGALECVLAGLIVGVGGQLGDLSMSLIKRDAGIKDMGTMIRGHGGVLDRIDSLIYVAPLFFHMARYFHGT